MRGSLNLTLFIALLCCFCKNPVHWFWYEECHLISRFRNLTCLLIFSIPEVFRSPTIIYQFSEMIYYWSLYTLECLWSTFQSQLLAFDSISQGLWNHLTDFSAIVHLLLFFATTLPSISTIHSTCNFIETTSQICSHILPSCLLNHPFTALSIHSLEQDDSICESQTSWTHSPLLPFSTMLSRLLTHFRIWLWFPLSLCW